MTVFMVRRATTSLWVVPELIAFLVKVVTTLCSAMQEMTTFMVGQESISYLAVRVRTI
ncbi:hypothetical protein ALP30_02698 [Pseudomonas syringae pv. primulae]|nr:hypothetical protein ALP30_02698 [Pseudomonas syringae pv. primulae]